MEWFVLMAPVPMTAEYVVTNIPALVLGCVVAVVPVLLVVRAALTLRNATPSNGRSGALECAQDLRRAHLGAVARLGRILGNHTIT